MDWQPIETAPKEDGPFLELILACKAFGGEKLFVTTGFWDDDEASWVSASNHNGYEHAQLDPTHWMPFPDPPA